MVRIDMRQEIANALTVQARSCPSEECCGLLAGRDGTITRIFAATNAASDPAKNYEIAPQELFRLIREIRAAKLELLGIYHSHPNGENEPSARDIELAYYPGTAYFILSPLPAAQRAVRAFSIRDGRATELEIQITRKLDQE
jgi:proteasome lid subunit RPN8/RPN11